MIHHSLFPFGHDALSFVSAATTAVAALLMAGICIPHTKRWHSYRRMRIILVTSYLVLSLSNFTTSLLQVEEDSPQILSTVTLIVSSFQALLFTATCLTFVCPLRVTARRLTAHFSVITAVGTLLLVLMAGVPEAFPVAYWVAVVGYAAQLTIYTLTFHQSFSQCTHLLEQHYDEEESGRLQWIKQCFYGALGIGVLALIVSLPHIDIACHECFTVVYTLYYVYMCHCMMVYRTGSSFIVEAMSQAEPKTEDTQTDHQQPQPLPDTKVQALEDALEKWQRDKQFRQADISSDEVAAQLGTSRRYLSWYFTTHKHTTFRSWRLKLRIAEAERILRECPDVSVAELHELVGMGDRSNFHKHFRLCTGLTPSEYKARYGMKRI